VGVDIGKSVNSTIITGWSLEKADGPDFRENVARLIYVEEITARTGGHDIPYQRRRIMEVSTILGADKLIIDATGIGGAIEHDLRLACIQATPQIHFIPFIFTGGPKGTKTQAYRDYVSFVQQQRVLIPNPEKLEPQAALLVNKWLRQHVELEYVMDAADKTERIAAPDGKHDDYCDSCVIALHATLTMLPGSGTFGTTKLQTTSMKIDSGRPTSGAPIFTTRQRKVKLNKYNMRGL
jgi:hypothetical protein